MIAKGAAGAPRRAPGGSGSALDAMTAAVARCVSAVITSEVGAERMTRRDQPGHDGSVDPGSPTWRTRRQVGAETGFIGPLP